MCEVYAPLLICDSDKIDNNGAKLAQLNLKDSSQFLPLSKCFFCVSAEKLLKKTENSSEKSSKVQ